ncbi:MAG: hypothetical protein ACFFCM_17870 [Promethearchaeota archaeon]
MMELNLLLYGMSGLTRKFPKFSFYIMPSAGRLNPIETCVVVNNVSNLKERLYYYDIQNHALECLREGDFRKILSDLCFG